MSLRVCFWSLFCLTPLLWSLPRSHLLRLAPRNIPDSFTSVYTKLLDATMGRNEMDEIMIYTEKCYLPLFGHQKFRPGQDEVMKLLLSGKNCLAVLPTAAGKSLLYTLSSQILGGITLVVCPLISLMRDQVYALTAQNIKAVRLDSSMSFDEIRSTYKQLQLGEVKILYVSPERFHNEAFLRLLDSLKIGLFVVDEAHCITEWGHSFRYDYLRLSHFASRCNATVRLALTATATRQVRRDITERLDIDPTNVVRQSSVRPNLALSVKEFVRSYDSYDDRLRYLLRLLDSDSFNGPMIIYVSKQKLATQLAKDLLEHGFNANAYHGAMTNMLRTEVESWFLQSDSANSVDYSSLSRPPIVVGTSAFGMGIDKSDVCAIVHFDLPRSVEEYVQGCGRAGRDGRPANCIAFFAESDITESRSQIFGTTPSLKDIKAFITLAFCKSGFPAEYDTAMLLNLPGASYELDVPEPQLRLCLAYLVTNNVLLELTPVYSSYTVGRVNEEALDTFMKSYFDPSNQRSSDSKRVLEKAKLVNTANIREDYMTADFMFESYSSDADINDTVQYLKREDAAMCLKIATHVMTLTKNNPRKKSHKLNTVELANVFKTTPREMVRIIDMMVRMGLVGLSRIGPSSIYNRYQLTDYKVDLNALSEEVFRYLLQCQDRSLARINEIADLLKEGCTGQDASLAVDYWQTQQPPGQSQARVDMWNLIAKYLDDEDAETIANDKHSYASSTPPHGSSSRSTMVKGTEAFEKHFDESSWAVIENLVVRGDLPADDPVMIARFATGVYSPRIVRRRFNRNPFFGIASKCEWEEVLRRSQQLVINSKVR